MEDRYLKIQFIAHVLGAHRVCWRVFDGSPSPVYDCTTSVTCTTVGETLTAYIQIIDEAVNNTCDDVIFEGYVQAECQVEGSLDGRDHFTFTFTPERDCVSYMLRCNTSIIESVTVNTVGSGYDPAGSVDITITGGGGSGAVLKGIVGDGGIKTESITSGGTYTTDAIYTNIDAVALTGIGTGAFYNVTVAGNTITALELVTPGTGYVIGDTFKFTAADLGGGTVDCVIEVDSLNTGEIESVDVTDAGLGFTSTPTIVFDDPISGTTATGTVVMAKCAEFDYVLCNTNTSLGIEMELGQQALVCDPTPSTLIPALETGYTIQATGCCYDCVEVQFKPDTSATITYIDCTDGDIKETTINSPTTLCVVNQSWWVTPADTDINITVVGDCNLA